MQKPIEITLAPEIAFDAKKLEHYIQQKYGLSPDDSIRLLHRTVDARAKKPRVHIRFAVYDKANVPDLIAYKTNFPNVSQAKKVLIIGAGPAGIFAALRLIELGIKPVIIERGKNVKERTSDIAAISRRHIVNPDSNYCFGEGGAGTYSDGKLYTRAKKRGDWRRMLEIFVAHGANANILYEAHPHIGTNKLPRIIAQMRENIIAAGGEVHFNTKVTDFILTPDRKTMKGVVLANGSSLEAEAVLLATGHSARDIFECLAQNKIAIEAKPFALGLRIEHRQAHIDKLQYRCEDRGNYLPPSPYALVAQVKKGQKQRGVFSFCMCPGGFIVPSATEEGEVVVNGMSPSRRNSKYANSGIVVSVEPEDWAIYKQEGALAALRFQQNIEKTACQIANGTQAAPAQMLTDFIAQKKSNTLIDTSYQPGLVSTEIDELLPEFISHTLREGFKLFEKKMKGYIHEEAVLVGVESRTSSPVRIPRDKTNCQHPEVKGLFPCGEGAGYAGGIASAAMDGERCAEQIALFVQAK
ncbi:MAG: NAD(P)/FAD-dependent oxidoreductase [Bernardetiaceae bacterium]|nr:NAD(P)/FAD-dependent oxidoreductase [Bernardetiaceae bacterium]